VAASAQPGGGEALAPTCRQHLADERLVRLGRRGAERERDIAEPELEQIEGF